MIILSTNIEQTFPTILVNGMVSYTNGVKLVFTNETTKNVYEIDCDEISFINDLFYLYSSQLDFLVEDTFFNLVVKDQVTNAIVYKDRVFVTNQNKNDYSINNGMYILLDTENNNYITI